MAARVVTSIYHIPETKKLFCETKKADYIKSNSLSCYSHQNNINILHFRNHNVRSAIIQFKQESRLTLEAGGEDQLSYVTR